MTRCRGAVHARARVCHHVCGGPPGERSSGPLWVTGAVVCAVLSRESLLASHPAYPVTLAAVAVVGLLLIGTGRQLVPRDRPRHRAATVVGRVAAAVVTVVVLGAIGYLVPLAAAPEAVAAMSGDSAVRVETSPTRIVLTPAAAPKAGLVFLPGAKVDPRAYVPLLTEVSARWVPRRHRQGAVRHRASSPPVSRRRSSRPRPVSPGGRSAATAWAESPPGSRSQRATPVCPGCCCGPSYPLGSLADRTDLVVASVSGTADAAEHARRHRRPAGPTCPRRRCSPRSRAASTRYFGDYGATTRGRDARRRPEHRATADRRGFRELHGRGRRGGLTRSWRPVDSAL